MGYLAIGLGIALFLVGVMGLLQIKRNARFLDKVVYIAGIVCGVVFSFAFLWWR